MEADLKPPTVTATADHSLSPPYASPTRELDSNCSTPYVSAPSSPGRSTVSFFYSAPASPMHYVLTSSFSGAIPAGETFSGGGSVDFEFSARLNSPATEIGSADELFLNGQIRPMKLSAHLHRPQTLTPLIDDFEHDNDDENEVVFSRSRFRDRRRTRSLSPLRKQDEEDRKIKQNSETTSSSTSWSSKRWIFIKEFLRSKSEGNKFWQNISFSPAKEKKVKNTKKSPSPATMTSSTTTGKRRSAHEMHYEAKRAQAEEMRKKTYLPYRQGLLGCLGFNSKSYGALNGFAKALSSS